MEKLNIAYETAGKIGDVQIEGLKVGDKFEWFFAFVKGEQAPVIENYRLNGILDDVWFLNAILPYQDEIQPFVAKYPDITVALSRNAKWHKLVDKIIDEASDRYPLPAEIADDITDLDDFHRSVMIYNAFLDLKDTGRRRDLLTRYKQLPDYIAKREQEQAERDSRPGLAQTAIEILNKEGIDTSSMKQGKDYNKDRLILPPDIYTLTDRKSIREILRAHGINLGTSIRTGVYDLNTNVTRRKPGTSYAALFKKMVKEKIGDFTPAFTWSNPKDIILQYSLLDLDVDQPDKKYTLDQEKWSQRKQQFKSLVRDFKDKYGFKTILSDTYSGQGDSVSHGAFSFTFPQGGPDELNESIVSIKGIRRKPMKVSENLDNIISTQNKQIIEPEYAAEEQTPVYADAMRNLKKTSDLRDEKINDDIENATNHNFEIGKEKKLTLEESLFTEDSEEYIIYRVTTLLDDEEDYEDFEDMRRALDYYNTITEDAIYDAVYLDKISVYGDDEERDTIRYWSNSDK